MPPTLSIRGAHAHNLCDVDLDLMHGEWIAIVGPSGSGKTSLVFDTLVREGQHRYLSSLSPHARQYFGKLGRAAAREITGLPPAIAVGQRALTPSARSTVGTITGALDLLRLLFARVANDPQGTALSRSHFSFNHPLGACEACKGLGVEDSVDPALLVADDTKSLRDGALAPTLKSGYTVYSQVTLDVMQTICAAHGFDVDTPWRALSDEQRTVILHGTRKLKVPFGKHAIESRMKWEGITARPREEGYYKGLVPVIEETLKRNRNPNILRFVRSVPCTVCGGSRLARAGREALIGTRTLPALLALPTRELLPALENLPSSEVLTALHPELRARLERMTRLGLGHLALNRESTTLSGGEGQRLQLAAQLSAGLGGVLFALDEPTLGLHPESQAGMRAVLDELRALGNTLAVVEHDPDMVRHADTIVHMGPGAGPDGGRVIGVGPLENNPLGAAPVPKLKPRAGTGVMTLRGATLHNLRGDDFALHLGALNVVLGPSGAGKSSLLFGTLLPALNGSPGGPFEALEGVPAKSVRALDARPIGRTSRSTPATWSGLFDIVRKRFAATEEARARKLGPGHFSYNNKSGRCPVCEGLGTTRVGLHLFENVELTCESCDGGRYAPEILEVLWNGKSIADVLRLPIRDAVEFFAADEPIARLCRAMDELGLGHLPLGQPSNQLSRGESQRVKLATLLGTTDAKPTLLLLDEPDRGLHPGDVELLIRAMNRLVDAGHTLLAISHHRHVWAAADFRTELREGAIRPDPALDWVPLTANRAPRAPASQPESIQLRSVRTNNLRDIDVDIPRGAFTAICGVSGSGKSSLAFGTLAAEAWQRFAESLPFEVRRHVRRMPRPQLDSASGLGPTLSLRQGEALPGRRSTVATQSGIGPTLRLLFSRAGTLDGASCALSAEHFSPDRALGACAECDGLGAMRRCDPLQLVTHPERSLLDGAMAGTRPGEFFGEPHGQYVATLRAALGTQAKLDAAWQDLPEEVREIALHGTGEQTYDVEWEFAESNKEGAGSHQFTSTWVGFLALVERESVKRAGHKSAAAWSAPLVDAACEVCAGSGLQDDARRVLLGKRTLPEMLVQPLERLAQELSALDATSLSKRERATVNALLPELHTRLTDLIALGLGALPLGRRVRALSCGERQRVRLASVLRAGLVGVTLILDEPSAGLQANEVQALVERLQALRAEGNTVIVVEHDASVLRAADHLIELGPGAGSEGGQIVASGTPQAVLTGDGPTARALRAQPLANAGTREQRRLGLHNINAGPLHGLDLDLPRRGLVAISGPSGCGKSTLLFDVLAPTFETQTPVGCERVTLEGGLEHFVAVRDARSAGRANSLLTALDLMGPLQKLYHAQAGSTSLAPQAFSFQSPKGRCPACNGSGRERVAMDFMADLELPCPTCKGKRYRPEVLEVRWEGLDAAQFLERPARALAELLPAGRLKVAFEALERVGLGHLAAGRSVHSLSGGERQRVAVAASLIAPKTPTLQLFDDPTAGLHASDVARLIQALLELAERGDLLLVATGNESLARASSERVALDAPPV